MNDIKLVLIGAGQMGGALLRGIISAKILSPGKLIVSDVRKDELKNLVEELQVIPQESNVQAVSKGEVIILAVKPQSIDEVLEEIAPHLNRDKLVISIVAGIATEHILKKLGKDVPLIRVMPNMPAFVRAGISVISPSSTAKDRDVEVAKELFSGVGKVVLLEEKYIDAATAISGCGPAYFSLLVEILEEAGTDVGLSKEVARKLATETLIGTARLLKKSKLEPKALKRKIASPGGMTEEALETFKEAGLKEDFKKGIESAIRRAQELSR